jgi:hypothetical protein
MSEHESDDAQDHRALGRALRELRHKAGLTQEELPFVLCQQCQRRAGRRPARHGGTAGNAVGDQRHERIEGGIERLPRRRLRPDWTPASERRAMPSSACGREGCVRRWRSCCKLRELLRDTVDLGMEVGIGTADTLPTFVFAVAYVVCVASEDLSGSWTVSTTDTATG